MVNNPNKHILDTKKILFFKVCDDIKSYTSIMKCNLDVALQLNYVLYFLFLFLFAAEYEIKINTAKIFTLVLSKYLKVL